MQYATKDTRAQRKTLGDYSWIKPLIVLLNTTLFSVFKFHKNSVIPLSLCGKVCRF